MTEKEMINTLKKLRFCVFWPSFINDDFLDDYVGFTERPIWVNSFGYGYYACDEPCNFNYVQNISDNDILTLKRSIRSGVLTVEEFKKTPFRFIFGEHLDDEYLEYNLESLIALPDHVDSVIYSGEGIDGWFFSATEEELIEAFDKKTDFFGGKAWEEMDTEALTAWYNYIFNENGLSDLELPFSLDILLS